MKSEEVLILPIIIGIGSPPFQVKVTTLQTETGPLYLILNQQALRAGMCILGLNSVSLYHCIISSQHLNSMMLLKHAQSCSR